MKNTKKLLILGLVALTILILPVVSSANSNYVNPSDVLSKITGLSADEIDKEFMEKHNSYRTIAANHGKLEEFQNEMYSCREVQIEKWVKDGVITREEADSYIADREFCADGIGHGHHSGFNRSGGGCNRGYDHGTYSESEYQNRHHRNTNHRGNRY